MNGIIQSGLVIASTLLTSSAFAGLTGETVSLTHRIDGSLFVPGGTTLVGPSVVVGAGIEWTVRQDVYEFSNPSNPTYIGFADYGIDIGDDYLELTIETHLINSPLAVYYQIPASFNGLVIDFAGPAPTITSAAISFGGVQPTGTIGAWNLWEVSAPAVEAWVDSLAMAPDDPARIFAAGSNAYGINTQGMAWALAPSGAQTMTMRADLTFVPAPGAMVALGLVGLASRRRRSFPCSR